MPDAGELGRVVLLAPTAKDGRTACAVLESAGILATACKDFEAFRGEILGGVAVAVFHEEVVSSRHIDGLAEVVDAQPPWSDLPLIMLARRGADSPAARRAVEILGNVTLLERPVRIPAFLSSVRSALRARERQHQIRDYLDAQKAAEARLRESEELLSFTLKAGNLGSWKFDLATGAIVCSPLCKANFGLGPGASLTHDSLMERVHPDDRAYVEGAIRESLQGRSDYDVEYRNVWPDGSVHWVLVRGRGIYDARKGPTGMAGVSLDVTARKQAEVKLRENDRRKDEFLAMLAHELRNPLSAIGNAARVLHLSDSGETLAWASKVFDHQVGHLSRMINDLLDVSRINEGKIQLRKEVVEVQRAVGSAVETVRPLVVERGHALEVSVPTAPVRVEADPTRLEQILVNLLNNAAKYTEAGGRITLDVGAEGGEVVVRVADNGMGIAPEKLPTMFELFAQGDRTMARSEGGLGIGLTLVRKLAEMHGGTITATSEGEGRGSEFVLRLPLTEVPDVGRRPSSGGGDHAPAAGSRILIVDDNVDSARGLARFLKLLGHAVSVAHDGQAALDAAREGRPDFVLLDIGLPGMDGYEVAERLRLDAAGRGAVLIAVTGYAEAQVAGRARASHFDHHLVKPVDHDLLVSLLTQTG